MPRPAKGQVIVDGRGATRTYAVRFHAYGERHYVTLGTSAEGWSRTRAQLELENILADVRRGIWRAAEREPVAPPPQDPTFHEFASRWFEANKAEWREKTRTDYGWQLSRHLLRYFKDHRLSQMTIAEVDAYRQAKVAESRAIEAARARGEVKRERYVDRNGVTRTRAQRPLSATSINKTITRLGQILEVAVEYGHLTANPARGRRRRLKTRKPSAIWLDRAEQIEALLGAAAELDAEAALSGGRDHRGSRPYRRALLATLVLAGLRIGELTDLRWRDVDLAGSRMRVRASKTDAGVREIDIQPALHDELAAHKARAGDAAPDDHVFSSTHGTRLEQGNIRRRTLDRAIARANERLIAAGDVPLPEGVTPHKLRHTFASILVALGEDPGSVMDQLGHADPGFTLRVYRHAMRREAGAAASLRKLVGVDDTTSAPRARAGDAAPAPTALAVRPAAQRARARHRDTARGPTGSTPPA
jgi:integrase